MNDEIKTFEEILDKILPKIVVDIEKSNPLSDEYTPDWRQQ